MAGSGSRLWWIVAFFACVPLMACSDPAPEQSGTKSSASGAAKKRTVADDMVAAVSVGKASTAVNVYFTLGNVPTVDTALPVDVAILPHLEFTSLQARFSTQGDGLTLVSGDVVAPVTNAKPEAPLEHKLVLMPKKEGVYMVTVVLDTEGSDGSVSRIFSIPVIVAAPAAAAPAAPAETPPAAAPN
jgi:hypothetical protein